MKVFPSVLALGAFVSALVFSPQAATAQVVEAEPGTELFEQFRPVYHFQAREKWMNDPCAPYYDAETGLYHMFYQSNPKSTVWGNMTWGHAVSKDHVTWKDYPDALLPFQNKWDNLGVFSGFSMDKAIDGKHTIFYTGVTKLPIAWKKPYLHGEHVLYATTNNGGKSWHKGAQPLIKSPPRGMKVTGWRDPMPFHSESLDKQLGYDAASGSNYLLVAGGIREEGPRVFLYHSDDYVTWEYEGFLLSQEKNTSFSDYSASWGFNFETTIYREMKDEDGELHNVMMFAAEGDPNRYSMWATGAFSADGSDSADSDGSDADVGLFTPLMVGVSDRSDWYANNIYTDKHGKDVVIGWITEDTGFTEGQPQGWDGILSLPREVGITIVRDIHDADEHLVGKGDWIVSESKNVTVKGKTLPSKTIKTLKVKPSSDLKLLRNAASVEALPSVVVKGTSKALKSKGKSFELVAQVSEFERGSQVGFEVLRSKNGDEVTTIVYDDLEKKVIIERSSSSNAECAVFADNNVVPGSDSVWGNFYLYDIFEPVDSASAASDSVSGSDDWQFASDSASASTSASAAADEYKVTRENLNFHVFVDVSSVEVFVNNRFALSARVYPCGATSNHISLTASGDATFEKVQVWTNPKHAWPAKRVVPTKKVSKKTGLATV